jgi:hypothetical protein
MKTKKAKQEQQRDIPIGPGSEMAKRFQSSEDITNDRQFVRYVQDEISELRSERYDRKPAAPGYRYKRDWFDKMTSANTFNQTYFCKHIADIWDKKSELSSDVRKVILYVCDRALAKTMKFYDNLDKAKENGKKVVVV